jgi:hypothetical protein
MIPLRSIPILAIALAALAAAVWLETLGAQQNALFAAPAAPAVHARHHAHAWTYFAEAGSVRALLPIPSRQA